ncbi:hypothetical protein pb186bvf_008244 [Paramecium bursaria]
MISDSELQNKVERIVDNYLRERKRSSIFQSQVDTELELQAKQIDRKKQMNAIIQTFDELIQTKLEDIKDQLDNMSLHMDTEILNLKNLVLGNMYDQRGPQLTSRTGNSFVDELNDSFVMEAEMSKKLKTIEDSFAKKLQHQENQINCLFENQQLQKKIKFRRNNRKHIEQNSKNQIQDQLNKMQQLKEEISEYLDSQVEDKHAQFKKILEEQKKTQSDKINLMWSMITILQKETEKLQQEKIDKQQTPKEHGLIKQSSKPEFTTSEKNNLTNSWWFKLKPFQAQ